MTACRRSRVPASSGRSSALARPAPAFLQLQRLVLHLAACLAALLAPATVPAQGGTGAISETVLRDDGARVIRVAPDAYAIIHDDATDEWPHGNTGVVIGDDGVLVIDSDYWPSRARADIALVRRLTSRPVRWLVNTHWHGDHTHGNAEYREAFPGLHVVSARENGRLIDVNLARWPRQATLPDSPKRAALARLEATLAAGRDSAGRALPAAERDSLARVVRMRREELAQLAAVRVVAPDTLFDGALTIMLGARRVELVNQGRANSPADVTVWLPADRVLFTGDIVVAPIPYLGMSHPSHWAQVLRRIEATPVAVLVPGHGEPMRDLTYVRTVRTALETAMARVDSLFRQGIGTADAVRAAIPLDDLRALFPVNGRSMSDADWAATRRTLADRAWACVIGYGC